MRQFNIQNPFELAIKSKCKIKLCPKIIKTLLLNAQYSLDHCKSTLSIYHATEKFKQFKPVAKQQQFSVEY